MRLTSLILALASLALAACADEYRYCGDGTSPVNGACVGDGNDCGPGTHEEDGQCVLDDEVIICGEGTTLEDGECVPITVTGEPPELTSVRSPTPYPGGGVLVLIGENFMLPDSGTTTVTIGGVAATGVQVLSNNFALADLPPATAITVEVELSNDLGDDAMDFSYTGLFAAERGCFGVSVFGGGPTGGDLAIVDPRDGTELIIGPIASAGGTVPHGVTAMAFAPDGTLWAVESVCRDDEAALLTIDRATGAATVVATITVEAEGPPPSSAFGPTGPVLTEAAIPDIAFVGATLYGYARSRGDLVTINTTTGATTPIATDSGGCGGCGLVATSTGELLHANTSDELELYGVDGTYVGYHDFGGGDGAPAGLTWLDGTIYAATMGKGGTALTRYDFAGDEVITIVDNDNYDALATPPELDGTPGAAPDLDEGKKFAFLHDLRPAVDPAVHDPVAPVVPALRADAILPADATVDDRGRRAVALADLAAGARVTVRAGDETLTLSRADAARYRVVENNRGELKLVDADGRKVMRGLTAIEVR